MRPMLASSSRMQLIGILQCEPGVPVGDGSVDVEQLVEQHRQDEVERLVGVGHDQEERRALLADHLELQLVLAEELADRGDGERRQADVARRDDRGLGLRRSGGGLEALVLLDDEVLLGGLRGRLVAAVVGDDPLLEALEAVLAVVPSMMMSSGVLVWLGLSLPASWSRSSICGNVWYCGWSA